ncbi:MAG: hypothetical protein LBE74_04340 [Treponema sp.]|jgi:hypothetical protein|nr:hypothetical protein [Treponema sp.]
MKKTVKIAIISAAAVAAVAGALFVVIPLATSKQAEARLGEALAEAGIPEDMWSVGRAYYVPLLGRLTVERLEFGERGVGAFLEAKKAVLSLDASKKDFFAGSVEIRDASFSTNDVGVTVKSLSVNDFSVDKALFAYSPFEAVQKLGAIRVSGAAFTQEGRTRFSLGSLNAAVGYAEGKIPFSSSVTLKDLAIDVRQFAQFPALRPEYRLSNLELKNSLSNGVYTVNLVIDEENLFTIKVNLGVSLPHSLIASGRITDLAGIDYGEEVKMDSLTLTYTDKSLLDHIFELAGMSGGRAEVAGELNETLMAFAERGGVDAERFANEAAKFIAKPGKFELKTNLDFPMSLEDISQNPFSMNVSLSINEGRPFTTGEY